MKETAVSLDGLARTRVQALTRGPKHHFFGYYDKCPWDATGRYILAMEVDFMDRLPGPDDVAVIGLIDLDNNNCFLPVAETRAWNWQQGAMLQWVPSASERLVVYNDRDGDSFVSVLLDVESGERRVLPLPVYALSHDGRSALSLNFARLHHARRGYGYAGVPDPWQDDPCPKDDGIYLMDLTTGGHRLVLSMTEVARFGADTLASDTVHWVDHLQFNPNDTRFCFLHRYQLRNNKESFLYTQLFTAEPDGSNLYCLVDQGMVSHFDWYNEHQLLAWTRQGKTVGAVQRSSLFSYRVFRRMLTTYRRLGVPGWVRRQIYGDGFYLLADCSRKTETVGRGILLSDGHCSYSPDRSWILTDTYPDQEHEQTLILYNPRDQRRIVIGRFYSLPELERTPMRCDLHPRWNRDRTQVCIDSTHDGGRQIYVLDVSNITSRG